MNIRRIIRENFEREARKQGNANPGEYADQQVNCMAIDELLDAISDAVDALLADYRKK